MTKRGKTYAIPIRAIDILNKGLKEESDRACMILAVAWMDWFLECRLRNELNKGNARTRRRLFSPGGPFSSFTAKLNFAYCAGWVSSDLYHDIQVIRDIRNQCAHDLNFTGLNDETYSKSLTELKTPNLAFHDWGDVKAAPTKDGSVVIYSGERCKDAIEELDFAIPGALPFRVAIPVILAVLLSQLDILFVLDEPGTLAKIVLPNHMNEGQQDANQRM